MPNSMVFGRYQTAFFLVLVFALAGIIGFFIAVTDDNWQGLPLIAILIVTLAIFLIPRLAGTKTGTFFLYVLNVGLWLRLGFSLIQWWVASSVYEGSADSITYHNVGAAIAQHIWNLELGDISSYLQWGTPSTEFFTGIIYSITGPTIYGGYLIYGLLAFFGSYWFYRSFQIAFPHLNTRLFAVLIFFAPTILFWSNGIGKDALSCFCLGMSAYGTALLVTGKLRAIVPLALGLIGVLWVRPHMAALLVLALVISLLLRKKGKGITHLGIYVASLAIAGGFAWFVVARATAFIGLDQLSLESTMGVIESRGVYTFGGGSTFQQISIFQPSNLFNIVTTILFRPFPWEAHNLQTIIQSLEEVLLAGLLLWRIKNLGRAIISSLSEPYLRYILIYIIGFIVIFSTVGNFGILARERAMLLPFLFMLIAYDRPVSHVGEGRNALARTT